MTMQRIPQPSRARWLLGAGLALPVLVAASCSRTSSGVNSGDLYVQSCSLACTDGQGGAQVFCGVVNVFQNTEISVLFSKPLDPASIGPASFQVIDVTNGTAPDGQFLIDPLDSRRAIFRPAIVFGGGGVSFSFRANTSYEVLIPGRAQGDSGPYITSIVGAPNESRMQCTIFTSEGITDPVPGNPRVEIDLVTVTSYDAQGDPATFATVTVDPFGPRTIDVFRDSPVVFRFNELMNVATLADNASGNSPFITVEMDLDGNITTSGPGDRLSIAGRYEFAIDNANLLTRLTFTPSSSYPSAGSDPNNPRLLVIRVPQQVVDLTNKPVLTSTGGGTLSAVTESLAFQPIRIPDADGENFDLPGGLGASLDDVSHGGANWGTFVGGQSVLAPGITGGSGRLGDLLIGPGETVTLTTDSQSFPLPLGLGTEQIDVIGNGTGAGYPFTILVTDGVFEFATLVVAPGGRLLLRGSIPARLMVRGPISVGPGGIIDASGSSAAEHDSAAARVRTGGGVPPLAGPGGGDGGFGADRADFTTSTGAQGIQNIGGLANAGAIRAGAAGGGIDVGGTPVGAGGGGGAYPLVLPTTVAVFQNGTNGLLAYNEAFYPNAPSMLNLNCVSLQMGGPGGGGAYALPGEAGLPVPSPDKPVAQFPPVGGSTNLSGVPGAAGDNTALMIEASNPTNMNYVVRLLDWEQGNLRGGAGGGGAGNHTYMTLNTAVSPSNGGPPNPPQACFSDFIPPQLSRWHDHSGASGGAGGGGIDIVSGKRIDLDGLVDVRGGQGGSSKSGAQPDDFGQYAMPGGGGAGGSLRMRAPVVDLLPGGARVDARGGSGGTAFWAIATATPTMSRGGSGSRGLVRIEDGNSSASQVTFANVRELVQPFDALDPDASLLHLSVAGNYLTAPPTKRPDSISASSSCWIQPTGNFLSLGLRADVPGGVNVVDMGWTMNVVVSQGGNAVKRPFRGRNAQFPMSWEEEFGNLLGYDLSIGEVASPIVVRFQGARTGQNISQSKCELDPNDFSGPIEAGTLTRWVSHPNELDGILSQLGNPMSPNIIRFVVLYDRTDDPLNNDTPGQILTAQNVLGVDDLLIHADPN